MWIYLTLHVTGFQAMSTKTEIAQVTMAKKPSSRKSRTPHATGQVTREIMGSRKKRVRMTAAQLRVLLPMFALEPNPTQETREELATQLNM